MNANTLAWIIYGLGFVCAWPKLVHCMIADEGDWPDNTDRTIALTTGTVCALCWPLIILYAALSRILRLAGRLIMRTNLLRSDAEIREIAAQRKTEAESLRLKAVRDAAAAELPWPGLDGSSPPGPVHAKCPHCGKTQWSDLPENHRAGCEYRE